MGLEHRFDTPRPSDGQRLGERADNDATLKHDQHARKVRSVIDERLTVDEIDDVQ